MSLGGGECRVGGAAARYDHLRRRGAESSPPSDRHQQTIDVGRRRPIPLPHRAPHKLLAQVEHPAGRSRMLVAVHGLALRSASDAMRAPLTAVVETGGCRAPPPSSRRPAELPRQQLVRRTSRAREMRASTANAAPFPLILQCRRRHHRFGAQARPSAASGHHPRTTRMSLGGGECRVGRAAARYDHLRRRGAESSPPSDRHQQTIDVGCRRPIPLPHRAPHKLLAQVEHPAGRSRMLVAVHGLALRSASDAMRAPLTAVVETGAVARHPLARAAYRSCASSLCGAPRAHGKCEQVRLTRPLFR